MARRDMPRSPIRPATTPGRNPGGRTCLVSLLGLLAGSWLFDLALAGSKAIT